MMTPAVQSPEPGSFELIVGLSRVTPSAVELVDGGMVAELSGAGLLKMLDATFGGQGPVEVWGLDSGLGPRAMMVTEITMSGATTLITLEDTGMRGILN